MDKKVNLNTIILLLILITLAGGGLAVVWSVRQVTQPLVEAERAIQRQFEQIRNPTPTIEPDPVTIVREVRGLSRLETAAYTVEKIITAESRQGPFAFLIGDRLIFVAHGQVIAGVDLGKLEESDVTIREGGAVAIALPEAEVFVTALDNDQSYIFDRDTGVIGMNVELETAARQAAEEEILNAALEDGILDMAQRNAESYIRHLILTLGFKEVRISY
ncbi:MAG: DUF4230 domain-containing protein [Chloroflexota bacterium]|nr:DUF4230 domain-containing protein [Chloroflexota bacterium]